MEETYTKEETKSLKVGLAVAVVIAAIFAFNYFTKTTIEHSDSGKYYQLQARFGRTDGLMLGANVRLAGIDVGRVVDAKLDDNFNAVRCLYKMTPVKEIKNILSHKKNDSEIKLTYEYADTDWPNLYSNFIMQHLEELPSDLLYE